MKGGSIIESLLAFLGGIGGTIVLLMPGYILGKVYGRNVEAAEVGGSAFVAASAIGGVITHLVMLAWTIPLAQALVTDASDGRGSLTSAHFAQAAAWIAL